MWPPVQVDDAIAAASVVVLHVDRQRLRRLHDSHHRALRELGIERQERHRDAETAGILRDLLGIVVRLGAEAPAATGPPGSRRIWRRRYAAATASRGARHRRRNPAVRRIDDSRGSLPGL